MSLSLWVGGLIIFFGIYYDVDKRYKYLCRDSENKVIRTFSYLVLALAQALLLAFLVKAALGLSVDNFGAYIAACCFVSVVFIAIIQFFIVELGDLGKFLSLLLADTSAHFLREEHSRWKRYRHSSVICIRSCR